MNTQTINPSLAIGVIIKNKNGDILLVQEKRNKYYENAKDVWGLPAGKVEWTESIEQGLRREMREELNMEIKPIGLIGVYQYLRQDSQCIGLAFLVEFMGNENNIKHNTEEVQNIQWLSIDKILNSDIQFRYGVKETLKDYKDNIVLPFRYVHFFELRDNKN